VAAAIGRAALRRRLARRSAPEPLAPDSALLVPAFAGLGAPFWDDAARPVLIAEGSLTSAVIVEAALLGLAHRVADCLEATDGPRTGSSSRPRPGALFLSGPLAAFPDLVRRQADVTGRAARVAIEPEATLPGWRGSRLAPTERSRPPRRARSAAVRPRTSAALRRALRERWAVAVSASRDPRAAP
jgi:glycerol kinase